MLTTAMSPKETLRAAGACACVDCKRAARKACAKLIAAITFDLAYRRTYAADVLAAPAPVTAD